MKCRAYPSALAVLVLAGTGTVLAQVAAPVTEDFEKSAVGAPSDSLMVIDGGWGIVEEAGNKVLELQAEPVLDAAILVGPSLRESAAVHTKVMAAKSRRAHPRMGVGLYGVSGVKIRLVPAQKKLELLEGEEIIAEVPFDAWTENAWWHIELRVSGAGANWTAEARVWPVGAAAPDTPTLSKPLPSVPGQGRASLIGSPYANKPIQFDDVVVTGGAPTE